MVTLDVCNRGTASAAPGVPVTVYAGAPGDTTTLLCETTTAALIAPTGCEEVSCVAPGSPPATVWAETDGSEETLECVEDNNLATFEGCP